LSLSQSILSTRWLIELLIEFWLKHIIHVSCSYWIMVTKNTINWHEFPTFFSWSTAEKQAFQLSASITTSFYPLSLSMSQNPEEVSCLCLILTVAVLLYQELSATRIDPQDILLSLFYQQTQFAYGLCH
jgi:hypothetical protein